MLICPVCKIEYERGPGEPRGKCHPCYKKYQTEHRKGAAEMVMFKKGYHKALARQIWGAKFHAISAS